MCLGLWFTADGAVVWQVETVLKPKWDTRAFEAVVLSRNLTVAAMPTSNTVTSFI